MHNNLLPVTAQTRLESRKARSGTFDDAQIVVAQLFLYHPLMVGT